ncbi:terminase small subunit [Paenilisteria rocourtiae]|uniref:Terminase small subunit n=1 Tax=Listeria rocourtiae TaxID=647910 RepID=A0A4R6ZNW2_9LIST|nr:terminase small subunit [Listeria rocourtiae]EUJ51807.1 phage terminase small subunit [Listeria rocourtiae FSL F6-920]TDR54197.1 terminase small subunit [Listeria rocourtiae]
MTKTEKKYRVFALAYVSNGFNATEAAKTAGYSEKTAESQASRLLKNVKVLEFIDEEMKTVSQRMQDDAKKVYKLLWSRILDCGVKLAESNEAKKGLTALNAEMASLRLKDVPLAEHVDNLDDELERMMFQTTNEAAARREEIEYEMTEYNNSRRAIKAKMKYVEALMSNFYLNYLSNVEYEKYARLQSDLLQDLFDRSGYKDISVLNNRRIEAQVSKAESEAAIFENRAGKIAINDAEKAQVNDLIAIGNKIIGIESGADDATE